MDDFLNQTFMRLLDTTDLSFTRFLYHDFKLSRLTGLIGPRGVGKTTLMLQLIKEKFHADKKVFYFSADSVYFRQSTLVNFVNELYQIEGYRIFFIDEIHQYANWNQEIKNLYDAFPDIKIVYSGSSTLELVKGSHDLSRRVKMHHLPGMSFREYLNFTAKKNISAISFVELIKNLAAVNKFSSIEKLMGHFKQYLMMGYYPFVFEDSHSYYERVLRIIDKIIFEDIPQFFDLKTQHLHEFKKILSYLATIPPGEVNTNNIANNMQLSHQTITHYLHILSEVGLIQMIFPFEGGGRYLRKPQKIFLHNTTLLQACSYMIGQPVSVGALRELYFIQALRDGNHPVYYSSIGDYQTAEALFEIGGKNKTEKQIIHAKLPAFLVKDDIVLASKNVIPLLACGFLY